MPISTHSVSIIVHKSLSLATRHAITVDDYLLNIIT
jgi:hypothetical protein